MGGELLGEAELRAFVRTRADADTREACADEDDARVAAPPLEVSTMESSLVMPVAAVRLAVSSRSVCTPTGPPSVSELTVMLAAASVTW